MKRSVSLASMLFFALSVIIGRPLLSEEIAVAEPSSVADHMSEHLDRITSIKAFIIMGDLAAVREPALWLAEHESASGLPDDVAPYLKSMRNFGREVAGAANLTVAAVAVSSLAESCGNCHFANDVGLAFGFDTVPDEWADTVSHMQRHQWALDRMWEGLIGPSDAAWNRGVDMLIDVPLHPIDIVEATTTGVDMIALDKMARRIHSLGSRGLDARTPEARADLYGEVLGLCAKCHTQLGRGPGQ